jgi:hypothetical protein
MGASSRTLRTWATTASLAPDGAEALHGYAVVMATARRTVQIELDEMLVSRARAETRDASRTDDQIVEDALSRYLLGRLLDKTQ